MNIYLCISQIDSYFIRQPSQSIIHKQETRLRMAKLDYHLKHTCKDN